MNAQLLEYARIALRFALADLSGGTKGQLQAFAEHPPADKNRNPRQPIHLVDLEDGRGGYRQVKAENTALYVLETRSRRRPMPPMNEYDFAMCGWRRAVNSLPEYQNAWVKYCYGHDLKFAHQVAFCEHVWAEYERRLEGKPLQAKVKKRLIALVWLAAQDAAAKNRNDTYTELAGTALGNLMSISQQCWSKVYASHWSGLKNAFERLDIDVLRTVLNRLTEIEMGSLLQKL
ncbi:bacteriophage antitermination protein Q [Rahnella sp. ChDrAdgB13]|uniref:bacteriophage antitermination protein Q n=1 Tax=Rahnella sp. ChDrAdgB13 TaxID=1850581 RepID=UPI001AD8650E|nr:bacteriophage antitermination protein Q [Rahnella sp. ChDrAdgB13]